MLELNVVRDERSFGYHCIDDSAVVLITSVCGCKPSKWDGCRCEDVAPQLWAGIVELMKNRIDYDTYADDCSVQMVSEFLYETFRLCKGHPLARVEVSY